MTLFDLGSEPGPEPALGTEGSHGTEQPATQQPTTGQPATHLLATQRLAMVVAYDGAGFRGFAAQAGQRTVAGELARAVSTVVRHDVEITCAGRTDAGVHALGQVVHFDVTGPVDLERLVKAVNSMLAPSIVVRRAAPASMTFDARRSAMARHYRYLVLEAPTPDPLLGPLSWHVPHHLDLRAMSAAADALVGEHDFRAFCRRPPGTEAATPIMRRVIDARWGEQSPAPDGLEPGERLLRFDIWARSFCHQMVRSVVGTLVDVGRGRRPASDVNWLLQLAERSTGTAPAPAQGLCLVEVDYGEAGPWS